MAEWRIVGPRREYEVEVSLHTVWGYSPDDDAIEYAGGCDEFTWETNPDFYSALIAETRAKYGAENVREVILSVPWSAICEHFEPLKADAALRVRSPSRSSDGGGVS